MIGTLFLLLALSLPQAGESTFSAARRLINEGQARRAIEQLEPLKAGADAALRMQIDLLLGVAYYHADDPARAVELLAPVVDHLPADSASRREAEQVLGLSAVVIGKFADAIPRLEATRKWAPDNQELAYALAQAYVQTQRPDSARATVASIYGVPADSAAAHLLAAQLMIRLEMEPQAEVELTKAVEKDARLPGANLLLGQIALFRGRLPEAVSLTQREIAMNPGNGMAFSQLGDAYVRQSKWDDAIAALQKSIWLNPYYSAPYILLARAYVKQAQPAVAEGMLRRAIQLDPNNRTAHYQLAQLLQQAGREEDAKREFEIAERNRRGERFEDVTTSAGLARNDARWGSGCSFLDYDRDGDVDLFVANYLRFDPASAAEPGQGPNCVWKGVPVNCGPKGLPTDTNLLYRNRGDGTFEDVSGVSGIAKVTARYPMTAIATDLDEDGWPDIYVASDSTAAIFYRNNRDGSFSDDALRSGIAFSPDLDNDGRADVVYVTGHVYPEVERTLPQYPHRGPRMIFRNTGQGRFVEATGAAGATDRRSSRGAAFGDFDNDGDEDVLVMNMNERPSLVWDLGVGWSWDLELGI